jgi:hypothetical protein
MAIGLAGHFPVRVMRPFAIEFGNEVIEACAPVSGGQT